MQIKNLLLLSIITGIITGVVIVVYGLLTDFLKHILFLGDPIESISHLPFWYVLTVPVISILFVNFLISKVESVKEYGVGEIAEAVVQNRMIFGIKDLILKIIASSVSLASGFAVGNEGPSAAIGAMIASKLHPIFNLPKELLRISISIGASGGIAAIFVSPVTGIMFAIENIAYNFVRDYVGYLIIAGALAFSVALYFLEPLIFNYSSGKFLEYRYLFASLVFIPVITFFIYFYLWLKNRVLRFLNFKISEKFEKYKNYIFGITGGFIIGIILLISPFAAFSGHEVVDYLINGKFNLSFSLIFLIIVLRIIATAVSIYANAVGGIFIALMSIGALVGYGFGELLVNYGINIEPFYFAAIGAAVFMGVNMKLPLTAVVMALEITYDYNVVVPSAIMVVMVGYLVSLKFDIHKLRFKIGENR